MRRGGQKGGRRRESARRKTRLTELDDEDRHVRERDRGGGD